MPKMKVNNENFDKVLNKLVASTRSPRGRFTAENSWRLLESRLLKRRSMKRFWMRTASAAAVVLLCVTSWAAYQFLYVAPQREAIPTEAIHTTEETQVIHSVLTFDQQPLQEIVRRLVPISLRVVVPQVLPPILSVSIPSPCRKGKRNWFSPTWATKAGIAGSN